MRFAFKLKTLMWGVAVAALMAWFALGLAADRRRDYLRRRADSFALGEADVLEQIAEKLAAARQAEAEGPDGRTRSAALRTEAEQLARVAAWHVKMERLYAGAVDDPWSPLPADYPPP